MILEEGLNKLRDLMNSNINEVDWGTGTTAANENDVGLEAEISSVEQSSTNIVKSKTLSVTGVLPSTDASGNTVSEAVVRFSDGTDWNRNVFTGISKTNSKEIHNISTFVFTQK